MTNFFVFYNHLTLIYFFAQDEDGDDDDDEEIPLDMEEVEAASKKARQDEDIHSEHVQVNQSLAVLVTFSKLIQTRNMLRLKLIAFITFR
jgi:hypothetical protein